MKHLKKMIVVLFLLLPLSMAGFAEDQMKPMKHGGASMKGMMGMMMDKTEEQKDAHMRKMQVHMLQMHDLSNRILAESDAAKKQALKDEQVQLMKDHMKKMMAKHKEMMKKHHQKKQEQQDKK